MKRKSIKIEELVERINGTLLHSRDDRREGRAALGFLLEQILMDTGNYRGFLYLDEGDMAASREGTTVGIGKGGTPEERFRDTDHTRVHYLATREGPRLLVQTRGGLNATAATHRRLAK
jgi:hypothetical protein